MHTFQQWGLLFLRLVTGGSMCYGHGWGKLTGYLDSGEIRFSDPIGLGSEISFFLVVFAEVVCALCVACGLFTRLATIPLIIVTLVIIFAVQIHHPFNKIELPLMYLSGFVVILAFGPGRYSLDALRTKLW